MRFIIYAIFALALAAPASAQFDSRSTGEDGALSFSAPPIERSSFSTVYDAARQEVLLFGGFPNSGIRRNDTWVWDGTIWQQRSPASFPSSRDAYMMVYDSVREVVVMFGGYRQDTNDETDETWEWDGVTWTRIETAASPSPRYNGAMAYDESSGKVVLYGGRDGGTIYGDTWEYDGANWQNRSPGISPGNRYFHAMAYDSVRGEVVLFGGSTTTSRSSSTSETWTYNGTTWTNKNPGTYPSRRWMTRMTWDSVRERVMLFGGEFSGGGYSQALYEWDGVNWAMILLADTDAARPDGRGDCGFSYDVANDNLVVFGGWKGSRMRDTWTIATDTWSEPETAKATPIFDMTGRDSGIWNFTTIDIPADITVKFEKNAANTPVIWRATGDISILGTLDLSGEDGTGNQLVGHEAQPGPGGYSGGLGGTAFNVSGLFAGTAGKGPGGGAPGTASDQFGGAAGHSQDATGDRAGSAYGSPLSQPLFGGSGGGGGASDTDSNGGNGGAGGGAIHLVSSGTILVEGEITAEEGFGQSTSGGNGGRGSGGTIRLSASTVSGSGRLKAGQYGRLRIEALDSTYNGADQFVASTAPAITATVDDNDLGEIVVLDVGPSNVPANPSGNVKTPDVVLQEATAVTIRLQTFNIPVGTVLTVRVSGEGGVIEAQTTATDADGIATVDMTLPAGVGTIQASATY